MRDDANYLCVYPCCWEDSKTCLRFPVTMVRWMVGIATDLRKTVYSLRRAHGVRLRYECLQELASSGSRRATNSFLLSFRDETRGVVFFSEPYEVLGGRGKEFYRKICLVFRKRHWRRGVSWSSNFIQRRVCENGGVRKKACSPLLAKCVWLRSASRRRPSENTWFALQCSRHPVVDCAVHGIPAFSLHVAGLFPLWLHSDSS